MLPHPLLIIVFEYGPYELQVLFENALKTKNYEFATHIMSLTYNPSHFLIDNLLSSAINLRDKFQMEWIAKYCGKPSYVFVNGYSHSQDFIEIFMTYNRFSFNDLLIFFHCALNNLVFDSKKNDFKYLERFISLGFGPQHIANEKCIPTACRNVHINSLAAIQWLIKNNFEIPTDPMIWKHAFLSSARQNNQSLMKWIINENLIDKCHNEDIGVLKRYKCDESIAFIRKHLPILKKQRILK